jgi:hypothetical protein
VLLAVLAVAAATAAAAAGGGRLEPKGREGVLEGEWRLHERRRWGLRLVGFTRSLLWGLVKTLLLGFSCVGPNRGLRLLLLLQMDFGVACMLVSLLDEMLLRGAGSRRALCARFCAEKGSKSLQAARKGPKHKDVLAVACYRQVLHMRELVAA